MGVIILRAVVMKRPEQLVMLLQSLAALSSLIAVFIDLKTKPETEGSASMENQPKTSMILVTVNQGYTDAVTKEHGLRTESGAMVSSIGVEQMAHLI